ncbi:30S ribosome-binding factor RbfA [Rhodohalobacter barkolensis]|jgi:ribosome-binding factor A|uniref:Ribosome-binding factor A n=1 Tax=Rhodohalobacter barkolensis TaxID=2053187 RepID=A0A2N0VJP2_9BACT|nr:30S ribosome-binding factor RbfA [Rhodohalobacter barkolensis]PKD44399.1 30S ribosome-binding factor RbfA [Rhodohalobacter barkolensis]
MSIRTERLSSVIKKDLGQLLQRNYQPSGTFITVTQVRMTDDLSIAKVYLSVFSPNKDVQEVYKYIDDHQDQIRYELASKIKNQVRRIPELLFYEDDTAEYVNKIENLFEKVRKQRKQNSGDKDE